MKRNPQLEFYLQADKALRKKQGTKIVEEWFPVREHYRYESTSKVKKQGEMVPEFSTGGFVDDAIRQQHPEHYAAFSEAVQKNQDKLYDAARAQVGQPVKVVLEEEETPKSEPTMIEAMKEGAKQILGKGKKNGSAKKEKA